MYPPEIAANTSANYVTGGGWGSRADDVAGAGGRWLVGGAGIQEGHVMGDTGIQEGQVVGGAGIQEEQVMGRITCFVCCWVFLFLFFLLCGWGNSAQWFCSLSLSLLLESCSMKMSI